MRETAVSILREWLLPMGVHPVPRVVSATFLASSGLGLCGAAYDPRLLLGCSATAYGALTAAVALLFPAPSRD